MYPNPFNMILIADSGSTKTDWILTGENYTAHLRTSGINPYMQDEDEINNMLNHQVCPEFSRHNIDEIYFYGSGCTPEKIPIIQQALQKQFPHSIPHVYSDLLGAARALCQNQKGIVCILGTGSNSCLYDGIRIVSHIPPLGFILGDEGSGAAFGKNLVSDLLKGIFPRELREAFIHETGFTEASIIERVYRKPFPNRFLASLSPFIAAHRKHPVMHAFIIEQLERFFIRNISLYPDAHTLPIHFTGSIAFHYAEELTETANRNNFCLSQIQLSPIKGLLAYHTT